jgi:hypothetical protein
METFLVNKILMGFFLDPPKKKKKKEKRKRPIHPVIKFPYKPRIIIIS